MAVAFRSRFLLALILGSLAAPASAESNYRLINSGIAERPSDPPPLYWLDQQTLLFSGYAGDKRKLFLWTVGDKPKAYAAAGWDAALADYCAADGKLRYALVRAKDEKLARWRAGAPGAEVVEEAALRPPIANPATIDGTLPLNKAGALGGLPCGTTQDPRMRGRLWAADFGRAFYLDFGPLQEAADPSREPVMLGPADRSRSLRLPIRRDEVIPECTQYVRHLEAFLIWNCGFADKGVQAEWKRLGCWPFWQVWPPQGHVEKGCLPYGPWAASEHELLPTQIGIYFVSQHYNDGRSLKDPGSAGLYRIAAGKAARVLSGMVLKPSVSPDGCLVAFTYAPSFYALAVETPPRLTVAAVNVCAAGRR